MTSATSYHMYHIKINLEKFLNNKKWFICWLGSKIRHLNFLSYFSQKSRVSELKRSPRPEVPMQISHLVDEVPEGQTGAGTCPRSHSRWGAEPGFEAKPLYVFLFILYLFYPLFFPNSFYGLQEMGRIVIFSLFEMSKMGNASPPPPIDQIQSVSYVRAKWDEKWLHNENKDAFEC